MKNKEVYDQSIVIKYFDNHYSKAFQKNEPIMQINTLKMIS
jgi:hypothetical protein